MNLPNVIFQKELKEILNKNKNKDDNILLRFVSWYY